MNCALETGTEVKTTQADMSTRRDWTGMTWISRKWGIVGKILKVSNSHGLCYQVDHGDGTSGWYNPTEISVPA